MSISAGTSSARNGQFLFGKEELSSFPLSKKIFQNSIIMENIAITKNINGKVALRCNDCGKLSPDHTNYIQDRITEIMKEKQVCFRCATWLWHLELNAAGRNFAVIEGHHFVLDKHTDVAILQGSGGSLFKIRFNDGREVLCDNLWHQGEIPENFRDRFPDNAKFVKEEGLNWYSFE